MFEPETVPYGIKRYKEKGEIVDALLGRLLGDKSFFLGDQLSIVDVSFFGWYIPVMRSGFLDARHKGLNSLV
ncbi:MAG: glutathione S-transferase C-terminal domain-containing protein [Candidatus Devosia symbiotica]|nr:glutathione S-transferase C-terminal domain-containing protein [Candidatus Devosia symbiotica]